MSPKRLDRVAPPPTGDEWDLRFGTTEAAKGWVDLCAQARNVIREAFDLMRSGPRPPEDPTHYRLRGDLSTRRWNGRDLEQWQIKIGSSGRIWYLPDDETHTVWLVYASPAHQGRPSKSQSWR
jgi:mRNA-degrading endonuclease RelE of RelBE toxin-antitoxin system